MAGTVLRRPSPMGRRIGAHLIDLSLIVIFVAVISIDWLGDVAPESWLASDNATWLWALVGTALNWVVLQGLTGSSVGKAVVGIGVVNREGRVPGLRAALIRTLPLVIEQFGVIGLIAAGRDPDRQRFGDRWAHTYVVINRPPRELRLAAVVVSAAALAAWIKIAG